jgi:hypothetical protein
VNPATLGHSTGRDGCQELGYCPTTSVPQREWRHRQDNVALEQSGQPINIDCTPGINGAVNECLLDIVAGHHPAALKSFGAALLLYPRPCAKEGVVHTRGRHIEQFGPDASRRSGQDRSQVPEWRTDHDRAEGGACHAATDQGQDLSTALRPGLTVQVNKHLLP